MVEKNKIVLFKSKDDCCACGACMNVCPKKAISMHEDEYGFLYPQIDYDICVGCGACKKVCSYQNNDEKNQPIESFAAINKNSEQKILSASGGLFAAFATRILAEGGVVFGSSLEIKNDSVLPHHIEIDDVKNLELLQGSKYVQSATDLVYKRVLELLTQGRKVLFSGTPCQVAGLKGFLRKDYDNLYLIDLICHGVPSSKFFNDYLQTVKKNKSFKAITGYSFRDKKKGWGMNCRIDAIDKEGKPIHYYTPARLASYNTLFLDGLIYRKNCYTCKYACKNRPGDVTIGDYWGIEKEHPEILNSNGFNVKDGISCLIINTPKGMQMIDNDEVPVAFVASDFSKVANRNKQLMSPSVCDPDRDFVMEKYKEEGYEGVEAWYLDKYRVKRLIHFIYNKIPYGVRKKLKR